MKKSFNLWARSETNRPALVQKLANGLKFEPCCEKTGFQGFSPGPTQTELYSYRRWLEA